MDIEFCIQSVAEFQVAERYAAKRVELCSSLEIGGITPSYGCVETCLNYAHRVEIHPIIRPHSGGFEYDETSIEAMEKDILAFARLGVSGVVFGVLDAHCRVDKEKNKRLLELAKSKGLEVTFHRAIDVAKDYETAFGDLLVLGFDRVLTSGQKPTAAEGLASIKTLAEKAHGRIQLMAGSGVHPENAGLFTANIVDAIHFTISKKKNNPEALHMGSAYEIDTAKIEGILNGIRTA